MIDIPLLAVKVKPLYSSEEKIEELTVEAIHKARTSVLIGPWPYGNWMINATTTLKLTITQCDGQTFTSNGANLEV